ncbi:hypothetical protein BDV11DRAFT_32827 [Aspergillus similis]
MGRGRSPGYNDLGKRYLVSLTYALSCQRCIKSEHMPFFYGRNRRSCDCPICCLWFTVFSCCLTKSFMFNGIQMSILFGSVACSMITFILVIISTHMWSTRFQGF